MALRETRKFKLLPEDQPHDIALSGTTAVSANDRVRLVALPRPGACWQHKINMGQQHCAFIMTFQTSHTGAG
jgi:hypothetical protein